MYTRIVRSTSVMLTLLLGGMALVSCAAAGTAHQRVATVPALDTSSGAPDASTQPAGDGAVPQPAGGTAAPHLQFSAAPTVTIDQRVWDALLRGYSTLVVLDTTATLLEETVDAAAHRQHGPVRHGINRAIAAGLLAYIDTALTTTVPHPSLATAFSAARPIHDELTQLLQRWEAGSIAADEVAGELISLHARIAELLATTDDTLAATFGIDPQQFAALRAEANARVRDQVRRP